jgi:phosphoribosylanthranilate isomerase
MSAFVKICGMTDEAAIHAAVEAGADAVGFVFHARSPRNLSVDAAVQLGALVPDGVSRVAVTLHPEAAHWAEIEAQFSPDALQTDIDDFEYLQVADGIEKWPVVREGSDPQRMPGQFVYEGRKSGQGQTVDWNVAASFAREGRMILAGGLSGANVAEAIEVVRPFGVDVSSAVESRPGVKDPALVREFVMAAKSAGRK